MQDRGCGPSAELVAHLPAQPLSEAEAVRIVHGLRVSDGGRTGEGEAVRLMLGERLLAIARPRGGELVTEVVLA